MGIVGAALVANWARNLITETGKVLLDREMDHPVVEEIRDAVETRPEAGETRIADLHVWRVGKRSYACALSVVTHDETLSANRVREQLAVRGNCPRDGRNPLVRPSWPAESALTATERRRTPIARYIERSSKVTAIVVESTLTVRSAVTLRPAYA